MGSAVSNDPLKNGIKSLKTGYAARLPDKIRSLAEDWQSLKRDWQAIGLQQLLLKSHSLMGSAPSFGFHAVGEAARAFNTSLDGLDKLKAPIKGADLASIDRLVEQLQQAVEQIDDVATDPGPPAVSLPENQGRGKLLYIVEDDKDLADYLALQLQQHGYDVHVFYKLDGLMETVKKKPPVALVMDIVLTEKGLAGPQAMFYIQKSRSKLLPVIFVSARTDMAARLAAVRAGGYAYLAKPVNIQVLLEKLHSLTSFRESTVYRILIVDDADRYASKCAAILQRSGMEVRILANPVQFLKVLNEFNPMLVLINSQLQGVSGLELAMIIRQQEHTAQLPVIFFAESFDHTLRRAVTQKICEDFISESAAPELVVAMVTKRIESTEQLRRINNREPLTGLYNRQWLLARLQLEAASADTPHSLTILYISLDNYKDINKIMGLMAGDAMIAETARLLEQQCSEQDALVRFGDNSFVVLNFEHSLEDVQTRAETLRVLLKEHVIEMSGRRALTTASIGIALYNKSIGSPELALLHAATACEEAFRRGGNRVQLHDSVQTLKFDRERQDYWHNAIAEAFDKDRFFLVYQPIVNLHGQSSKYFSVLLRMLTDEAVKMP